MRFQPNFVFKEISAGLQVCPKARWRRSQERGWGFLPSQPPKRSLGRSAPQSRPWSCLRRPRGKILNAPIWRLKDTVLPGNCISCICTVSCTQWFERFPLTPRLPIEQRSIHIPCRAIKIYIDETSQPELVRRSTRRCARITPDVPLRLAPNLKQKSNIKLLLLHGKKIMLLSILPWHWCFSSSMTWNCSLDHRCKVVKEDSAFPLLLVPFCSTSFCPFLLWISSL